LLPPNWNPRRAASGALLALTDGRASEGLDESHKLPRDIPNTGEENHGGSAPDDTSVVAALEAELLGARGKGVVKQRPAAATPSGRPLKVRKCPAALTPRAPRGTATPSTPATAGAALAGKTNFTTHYKGVKINVQVVQKAYRVFLDSDSPSDWKVPWGDDKDAAWSRVVARIRSL